ncbi:MAG: alpha-E domain-containing protein [Sphingomonadaceae bacterium]|nr:alpha-E domain-containing protein [Sphingomonadaceae bacterium]
MLGRTANGLFWMFRYLERADNTARMLEAARRMSLTSDDNTADEEWRSIIQTLGQQAAFEAKHDSYSGYLAWNFILRDKDNPANIRDMMSQVRSNARAVRNAISTELWTVVNESWLALDTMLSHQVGQGNVGDVVSAIRRTGTLAHGAMDGSMLRDESYHFARCGTFLERADSTARILDMKYYLLLPSLSYVGSSLDQGQWDMVLRCVSGDHALRWLSGGQIDARAVAEFLVLDQRFPRSIAFCHSALRDQLAALARIHGREGQTNMLMRQSDLRLTDLTIDGVFDIGLHEFLVDFTASNASIASAIASDYRFLD